MNEHVDQSGMMETAHQLMGHMLQIDAFTGTVTFGFTNGEFNPINVANPQDLARAKKYGLDYQVFPTSSGGPIGVLPSVEKAVHAVLNPDPDDVTAATRSTEKTLMVDAGHDLHLPELAVMLCQQNGSLYRVDLTLEPEPSYELIPRYSIWGRPIGYKKEYTPASRGTFRNVKVMKIL